MAPKVTIKSKDHGWDEFWTRVRDLTSLKSARVKVGVLSDSVQGGLHAKGKDGKKAAKLTLAELAAVLHYGTQDGHIPPRPFLTMTLDAKRDELKKLGSDLMANVIMGRITLEQALNAMGSKLAADVKATIAAGVPPPNAPSTAIAKAMKGKTGGAFKQKKQRHIGDAIADAAATSYVEGLGGHGRGGRKAVGAARNLGGAFAQIGAIASVKPLIDTGRLMGAVTWSIALNGVKK